MELRSKRVLKRGKDDLDPRLKNLDSSDRKKASVSSDQSNSGKKGGSEVEIGVCVDNADEDLEIETSEGIKNCVNKDDKGLFFGSEVLNPVKDLSVSSQEGETEETSVDIKEETESLQTKVNKKQRTLPVVSENLSEHQESEKCNRGTKRKIIGSSEKKEGRTKKEKVEKIRIPNSGRVLRSQSMNLGGRLSGSDECIQLADRPKKKLKRRGRPPMVKTEDGSIQLRPRKKLKRRGRPPKVQSEPSHEISSRLRKKDMLSRGIQKKRHKNMFGKLKFRGRPMKSEAKTLATHVIKMRTVKLMAVKTNIDVKRGSKILKTEEQDSEKEENVHQSPKIPEIGKQEGEKEENEHKMAEFEAGNGEKGMKRTKKQLVRDKLVDIVVKAGWIIDRRQRQERTYQDCVYIEPSGRSHWSITAAYAKLKKKIEEKEADDNEISAYEPIPEEEMSLLFRYVDKELGYKKKKNRIGKSSNKDSKMATSRKKKKDGSKRKTVQKSSKRCLLARSSSKQDTDRSFGKRNLLSWMIDLGVILSGSKVQFGKTRCRKRSSEGTITIDGIRCSCCNEIMGLSGFVAHAGGKLSQSFDNMFLESGTSLRKCLEDSWRKEEESNTIRFNIVSIKGDDPNDDTCNICGDGGNLVCCDGCPSTFHQSCLNIQNFPSGDWNCFYCSCKFCGAISLNAPHVDELKSEMLSCCLCEEKFHRLCLEEAEAVNTDSNEPPFCGRKCRELFERLQTYLGVRVELEDGFSWTLLQHSEVGQDFTVGDAKLKVECNSKLAVAFSVMDECFVPIVDERSRTNIIHNVVYNCGSNFRRLNYAGFLTAVLEKGDELVTAASIRIHGYRLAEMPFIGTRHTYRRQGMCRRLLDAIESTLSSIGVEELVIPAIPQLLKTWTEAFGFIPIEEPKREAMKSMSMVVFPGIDMLRKPLLQAQSSGTEDAAVVINDSNGLEKDSADVIEKDAIDERAEEAIGFMDGCMCPQEDVTHIENDKSSTSCGADSLCDLNFPVKDAEAEMGDDICGAETSPKLVLKNTFDLNLQPTGVDTDVVSDDSDSLPIGSEAGVKSFEPSDFKPGPATMPESKPCDTQPLLLI